MNQEPQNDKERAKAKHIWKEYRWTWARYWALGVKQGWKCAICGRSAKNMPLNVDHEHFKIVTERSLIKGWWNSQAVFQDGTRTDMICARPKAESIRITREKALPLSVRGLLCPGRHRGCNRLLGRVDNPEWLEKARNYLLNPPAKTLDILPKV